MYAMPKAVPSKPFSSARLSPEWFLDASLSTIAGLVPLFSTTGRCSPLGLGGRWRGWDGEHGHCLYELVVVRKAVDTESWQSG